MKTAAVVREHLVFLYGESKAGGVMARLEALLAEFEPAAGQMATPRGRLRLTEQDALLITYGDMLAEPGQKPLRTLAEFCERHLREVLSGLHLLPHYAFTSDDGFAVTDYLLVNPELGDWTDVRRLGDSFDLMFDAVLNHLSAKSDWFERFLAGDPDYRDFFVTVEGNPDLSRVVRPRALPLLTEFRTAQGTRRVWTTFSADQVDLNFANPEVFLATLRVLLFYVAQGARFIRLDAIAYLWKELGTACIHLPQTHRVIQLWRTVLDAVAPEVMLITETNVPHADNLSYFGNGRNEAQLIYNFALPPLVLHALLRGDASALTTWAQSLALPSDEVTFFNFLASHDGIGLNPARGILPDREIDYLVEKCLAHGGYVSNKQNPDGTTSPYEMNIVFYDAVNGPAVTATTTGIDRFMVTQGILLALQGMPGIYFHSLFGSRNDRAGAERTGIFRRINRQKLTRAELEEALANPDSMRGQIFSRYRELLQARRRRAAFHPLAGQRILPGNPRVFAVLRESLDGRERVLCLHNVTGDAVTFEPPRRDTGSSESWTPLLKAGRLPEAGPGGAILLQPYEVCWLRSDRGL